jgi:hypothetical protein
MADSAAGIGSGESGAAAPVSSSASCRKLRRYSVAVDLRFHAGVRPRGKMIT